MPAWVAPAIMGAMAIGQGVSQYRTEKDNAEYAEEWADYNAAIARRNADFNATAIDDLAKINADFQLMAGDTEATIADNLSAYNAALRLQASEFNALLLEQDALYTWEAQKLDQLLFQQQVDQLIAASQNAYAGAGVEISSGTPLDLMVDQKTQAKLQSFIIRHNAHIQVSKILDAAAMSRWEGEAETAAILYQGDMAALSARTNSILGATNTTTQAAYDALVTRYTGEVNADQAERQGDYAKRTYDQRATNSLVSGLFNAGSYGAKAYKQYSIDNMKVDTYNPPTLLSGTKTPGAPATEWAGYTEASWLMQG